MQSLLDRQRLVQACRVPQRRCRTEKTERGRPTPLFMDQPQRLDASRPANSRPRRGVALVFRRPSDTDCRHFPSRPRVCGILRAKRVESDLLASRHGRNASRGLGRPGQKRTRQNRYLLICSVTFVARNSI
jgi:hypothetical protein